MDRLTLDGLGREDLVVEARKWGVKRPEVMTRVELADEILRIATPNPVERKKVRGWLGVARDLIASAVERGLNLPDAAALIRGDVRFEPLRTPQPPVATVTLAEIYGAQGHFDRALGILDEVLSREPEHGIARTLRSKLAAERDARKATGGRPAKSAEPVVAPEPTPLAGAGDDVAALLRSGPFTARVFFELARVGRDAATGLALRIVEMRPRPSGAERIERELPISGFRGTLTASGLEPGSVVRAVIGWRQGGRWMPLAVAGEVQSSAGGVEVVWAPRRGVDYAAVVARVESELRVNAPSGVVSAAL